MVSPLYAAYNVLYQIATLVFLWIANKEINDSFVPAGLIVDLRDPHRSLVKVTGHAFLRFIFLTVEAAVLIFIITVINQLFLRATKSDKKRKLIAGQTIRVNAILTFCFILILLYGHFLAGFW